MKLKNLFSRSKIAKNTHSSSLASNHLDKKLVQKIHSRRIPSWTQLKYLNRFLDRREKKIIILAIVVIFLTSLFAGSLFLTSHIETVAKEGGTYTEALIGEPKYINPLFSNINDVDSDLTKLIYSSLFTYNDKQKLIPELAEKHTLSEDKKIYTITLKPNLKWSDGEELNSDDVLYTFEMIQNNETGSPLYSAFQGIQVEKIDNLSIRFTLKEPFAPFLDSLTVGILPEHIWSPATVLNPNNIKLAKTNLQPIGSGPWKFEKLIKTDEGKIQTFELSRNENYFGKKPLIQNLNFHFFDDCVLAFQGIQSQDILGLSFVSCKKNEEVRKKNLNLYSLKLPQYTALFFNQTNSTLLKDKDLRLALNQGINKANLVETVLQNDGEIIDAPILKESLGYFPEIKKISFNSEQANILLDKNWSRIQPEEYFKMRYDNLLKTYKDNLEKQQKINTSTAETNSTTSTIQDLEQSITTQVRAEMESTQTFYRKDKQGNVLQLTITTVDTPEYDAAAHLLVKQWQALGIQTSVRFVNKSDLRREILRNHNYQILLYGEVVGADPDLFAFWHSSQVQYPGLNLALFSNRDADKLLEDARKTNDPKERSELYKKLQTILIDELPAVFLYSPSYTYIINKQVKGVQVERIISPADRFNTLSDWYIKTKWIWK